MKFSESSFVYWIVNFLSNTSFLFEIHLKHSSNGPYPLKMSTLASIMPTVSLRNFTFSENGVPPQVSESLHLIEQCFYGFSYSKNSARI